MATSATHNGWHYDAGNARLDLYFRGTRIGHLSSTGFTLLTGLTHVFAGTLTFSGNPTFTGTVDLSGATVTLPTRSAFVDLMPSLRAADGAALAASETAGDHFIDMGTNQYLIQGEATINETEASVSRFQFILPEDYVAAGTITLRVSALVTLAGDAANDAASTIDFSLFKVTKATGAIGSDLVTTAAQTLATAGADYDFVVTPTGLAAGDIFSGVFTTSVVETAGGTGAANATITRIGAVIQVNK